MSRVTAPRPNPWTGPLRPATPPRTPTPGEARRAARVALWTRPTDAAPTIPNAHVRPR